MPQILEVECLHGRMEPPNAAASPVTSHRSTAQPVSARLKFCFDPRVDDPRRRYGLHQLFRFAGIVHAESTSPEGAIYYGDDARQGARAAVWIRADRTWPARFVQAPDALHVVENCIQLDLARAVFAHLTLEEERASSDRDAHGRVIGRNTPFASGERHAVPPVHTYIDCLVSALKRRHLQKALRPRWPHGAQYAACLTHDVDDPESPRAMPSLIRSFLRPGNKSRRADYWKMRAEIKTRGFYDACLAPVPGRREWDFPQICELEARCGFRSAFYFAVVDRRRGHPNDVEYDAARRCYRRLYATLQAGGWEVGLHAAYATRESPDGIASQVKRLDSLTGGTARGIRHHYLQVDHQNPDRSLMDHARAGLRYDTSIGFNDCPGFRAGAALPYQPCDVTRGAGRDFVELPLSIADMHLPKHDVEAAVGMVLDHLRLVRSLGGLAVLDWHVGHWHTAPAWKAAYVAACEFLAADTDAFVATPQVLAEGWLKST